MVVNTRLHQKNFIYSALTSTEVEPIDSFPLIKKYFGEDGYDLVLELMAEIGRDDKTIPGDFLGKQYGQYIKHGDECYFRMWKNFARNRSEKRGKMTKDYK
jgi:hypothetical protein